MVDKDEFENTIDYKGLRCRIDKNQEQYVRKT